jgi:hypothetical protein
MLQYLCLSRFADAHFVALSMFDDILGSTYAKPIYVEKTVYTSNFLLNKCEQRMLLGRWFYSLIKNQAGTYRYNSDIYNDSHRVLGLDFEPDRGMAFGLMRLRSEEIKHVYSPRDSFKLAQHENSPFRAAISVMLKQMVYPKDNLGLIGSLGIDPGSKHFGDIDLIFYGGAELLSRAHEWVISGDRTGPPLRHPLQMPLPTICSFYAAEPVAYPDLRSLRVGDGYLSMYDLLIEEILTPSFLNIQVYLAREFGQDGTLMLVVRDTLSRDMICPGQRFQISGFPAFIDAKPAVLVTDVEKQIPAVSFHGGGAKCFSQIGSDRQS